MPSGIILSSGSQGATKEAIEKVLADNGFDADQPETTTTEEQPAPKREDFKTEEEFAQATEEFEAAQEQLEEEREEEEQKKAAAAAPKPSRKQRAIDKATRELREQNRRLEERLAALEGKGKEAKTEPEPAKATPRPKREAFDSDEKFEEALFDWNYQQRRAKELADEAAARAKTQREEHWANYKEKVADFAAEHDDFNDVVNDKIRIHEAVYEAIIRMENPEITYYLGKHPDFADKLADMDPFAAVMEVARLAERLKPGKAGAAATTTTREKQKPTPRIPEPVKPLPAAAATSSTLTSREAAEKRNYRAFKAAQRRGV
jgi:hypothetical protein